MGNGPEKIQKDLSDAVEIKKTLDKTLENYEPTPEEKLEALVAHIEVLDKTASREDATLEDIKWQIEKIAALARQPIKKKE